MRLGTYCKHRQFKKSLSCVVEIPLPVLSLARSPKLVTECQSVRPTICCPMAPRDSTPTRPCSHLGRRASATSVLRLRGFGASPTDGTIVLIATRFSGILCIITAHVWPLWGSSHAVSSTCSVPFPTYSYRRYTVRCTTFSHGCDLPSSGTTFYHCTLQALQLCPPCVYHLAESPLGAPEHGSA